MGSPLPDPAQKAAFLQAAREMGFLDDEFVFGMASKLDEASPSRSIVHHVWIARREHRKSYLQAPDVRWLEQAREELSAGAFGAPLEFAGKYDAERDGQRYDFEALVWPWRDGFTWEAIVRAQGISRGKAGGQVHGTGPTRELVERLVHESIESRSGIE